MAESFSREKLRVRPTNLMSRMNGKKTNTHIFIGKVHCCWYKFMGGNKGEVQIGSERTAQVH